MVGSASQWMASGEPDLSLWGKSRGLRGEGEPVVRYPLMCHLLDAAAFAGSMWDGYLSFGLRTWLAAELKMSEQDCRCFVMFLAGIHDVGKACPGFQQKVSVPDGFSCHGDCTDHAHAGHLWIGAALQHKLGVPSDVAIGIGEIVGGHHGVFKTLESTNFEDWKMRSHGLGTGSWGRQRLAHLLAMRDVLGFTRWPQSMARPVQVMLCAVVVLADWLASRQEFVRSRLPDVPRGGRAEELWSFFSGSQNRGPVELVKAGLTRLRLKPGGFEDEFGLAPNRLQNSLESALPDVVTGPGLLIITEQTGKGKTEAALFAGRVMMAATGTAGLSFLLPTMATSNAMESRIAEYLQSRAIDPAPLNLLHSMAWLRRLKDEMKQGDAVSSQAQDMLTVVTEWLSGGKKAAFAPVSVGTIDQALLSVLPVRHNAFRMLAFANKTIIIDEVHAFDPYVYELLSKLLAWCGHLRVPVILMSATLPGQIARLLAAAYLEKPALAEHPIELSYPGWCYIDLASQHATQRCIDVPDNEQQNLRIELYPCDVSEHGMVRLPALKTHLSPLLDSHGSAAVICTTVDEAQRTYRGLRAWLDDNESDVDLILLHARMPLWQREKITDDITQRFGKKGSRDNKTIVVSTQVIEQSVDIDMDLVLSDLAPLELLLQRAGRGQRHPENAPKRPHWAKVYRLVVFTPQGEEGELAVPKGWSYVYPEAAMIRTYRLLARYQGCDIRLPGDVKGLVDTVHTDASLIVGHQQAQVTSRAEALVEFNEAARKGIRRPNDVTQIEEISKGAGFIDDEAVSTRFNADSVRVLPCFRRDGELHLDPQCCQRVPAARWADRKPFWDKGDLASIIEHTIPLMARYVDEEAGAAAQPDGWSEHHLLKHVLPLAMDVDEDGQVTPVRMCGSAFRIDPVLGLVRYSK